MFAYLDPGSGSMIAQVLVAGAAGVAVVGKLGWSKITSPLRRNKRSADAAVEPEKHDVEH